MIFVNGITENMVFAFIPGLPTILFTMAVLWRANAALAEREPAFSPRPRARYRRDLLPERP
jgi:hypothetical protein